MIGELEGHRGCAPLIPLMLARKRKTQGMMRPYPIMFKELQEDQGIPGRIAFGKGMGFASEGIEPIAQGAIDALNMHGAWLLDDVAQHGADLHRKELAMFIAMFDALRQTHVRGNNQRWASAFAGAHRLPIRLGENVWIASPAIAAPGQGPRVSACDRLAHGSLDQIVADAPGRAGSDETAGAILHQASPAFSCVGWLICAVFLRTNDQNSSISTVERCKSSARTAFNAAACSLALRSQMPMVSYLCPVISSAARRLPRRMTTSSACATSEALVCNRYIGVPIVSPKKRPQPRHWYRRRPPLLPLRMTCGFSHAGLGHLGIGGFSMRFHPPHPIVPLLSRVTTEILRATSKIFR